MKRKEKKRDKDSDEDEYSDEVNGKNKGKKTEAVAKAAGISWTPLILLLMFLCVPLLTVTLQVMDYMDPEGAEQRKVREALVR